MEHSGSRKPSPASLPVFCPRPLASQLCSSASGFVRFLLFYVLLTVLPSLIPSTNFPQIQCCFFFTCPSSPVLPTLIIIYLCLSYLPRTTLHILSHIIITITLWSKYYYYFNSVALENKVQVEYFPKSHRYWGEDWENHVMSATVIHSSISLLYTLLASIISDTHSNFSKSFLLSGLLLVFCD